MLSARKRIDQELADKVHAYLFGPAVPIDPEKFKKVTHINARNDLIYLPLTVLRDPLALFDMGNRYNFEYIEGTSWFPCADHGIRGVYMDRIAEIGRERW